jgi:hypothetical protein
VAAVLLQAQAVQRLAAPAFAARFWLPPAVLARPPPSPPPLTQRRRPPMSSRNFPVGSSVSVWSSRGTGTVGLGWRGPFLISHARTQLKARGGAQSYGRTMEKGMARPSRATPPVTRARLREMRTTDAPETGM